MADEHKYTDVEQMGEGNSEVEGTPATKTDDGPDVEGAVKKTGKRLAKTAKKAVKFAAKVVHFIVSAILNLISMIPVVGIALKIIAIVVIFSILAAIIFSVVSAIGATMIEAVSGASDMIGFTNPYDSMMASIRSGVDPEDGQWHTYLSSSGGSTGGTGGSGGSGNIGGDPNNPYDPDNPIEPSIEFRDDEFWVKVSDTQLKDIVETVAPKSAKANDKMFMLNFFKLVRLCYRVSYAEDNSGNKPFITMAPSTMLAIMGFEKNYYWLDPLFVYGTTDCRTWYQLNGAKTVASSSMTFDQLISCADIDKNIAGLWDNLTDGPCSFIIDAVAPNKNTIKQSKSMREAFDNICSSYGYTGDQILGLTDEQFRRFALSSVVMSAMGMASLWNGDVGTEGANNSWVYRGTNGSIVSNRYIGNKSEYLWNDDYGILKKLSNGKSIDCAKGDIVGYFLCVILNKSSTKDIDPAIRSSYTSGAMQNMFYLSHHIPYWDYVYQHQYLLTTADGVPIATGKDNAGKVLYPDGSTRTHNLNYEDFYACQFLTVLMSMYLGGGSLQGFDSPAVVTSVDEIKASGWGGIPHDIMSPYKGGTGGEWFNGRWKYYNKYNGTVTYDSYAHIHTGMAMFKDKLGADTWCSAAYTHYYNNATSSTLQHSLLYDVFFNNSYADFMQWVSIPIQFAADPDSHINPSDTKFYNMHAPLVESVMSGLAGWDLVDACNAAVMAYKDIKGVVDTPYEPTIPSEEITAKNGLYVAGLPAHMSGKIPTAFELDGYAYNIPIVNGKLSSTAPKKGDSKSKGYLFAAQTSAALTYSNGYGSYGYNFQEGGHSGIDIAVGGSTGSNGKFATGGLNNLGTKNESFDGTTEPGVGTASIGSLDTFFNYTVKEESVSAYVNAVTTSWAKDKNGNANGDWYTPIVAMSDGFIEQICFNYYTCDLDHSAFGNFIRVKHYLYAGVDAQGNELEPEVVQVIYPHLRSDFLYTLYESAKLSGLVADSDLKKIERAMGLWGTVQPRGGSSGSSLTLTNFESLHIPIPQGTILGAAGSTGYSNGAHLHLTLTSPTDTLHRYTSTKFAKDGGRILTTFFFNRAFFMTTDTGYYYGSCPYMHPYNTSTQQYQYTAFWIGPAMDPDNMPKFDPNNVDKTKWYIPPDYKWCKTVKNNFDLARGKVTS